MIQIPGLEGSQDLIKICHKDMRIVFNSILLPSHIYYTERLN
ncbi:MULTISPECIES: hypothetical protein [Elizabethkingia]|nr:MULTISPECIES: hypothetical protein [Elizabethkingia]MDX8574128.1 hypothetical protein [Elizabethkingia sp. HX WYD]MEC4711115.1 hypothetical protein [Elizabethkingia meningoseptica]WBS74621.1 hypothetical protein PF438_17195 [Elizabethkingia meningoseptica]